MTSTTLSLDDLQGELPLPPDGFEGEDAEFQHRARAAREPQLASVKVGDRFDVYHPWYRRAKVAQVASDRKRVLVEVEVDTSIVNPDNPNLARPATQKWREIWGVATIDVLRQVAPGDLQPFPEEHVVVLQEDRPMSARGSCQLVPKIAEGDKEAVRAGQKLVNYQIVKVMPIQEDARAVQTSPQGKPSQSDNQTDGQSAQQDVVAGGDSQGPDAGDVREHPGSQRPRKSRRRRRARPQAHEVQESPQAGFEPD